MSERKIEEHKRCIADLETAYALAKKVFEHTEHITAKKDVHESMFALHMALTLLKQTVEYLEVKP